MRDLDLLVLGDANPHPGLTGAAARPRGLSGVLSRGDDRAILTSVGAIADLRGELVDRDLLGSARHVHVSSYFLQPRLWPDLPTLFDEAHDAGATTSVDPNWDPSEGG